jgi:hypothetical protein
MTLFCFNVLVQEQHCSVADCGKMLLSPQNHTCVEHHKGLYIHCTVQTGVHHVAHTYKYESVC